MKFLPNMPLFNRLVMNKKLATGAAMDSLAPQGERVGQVGKTTTDLRPAGKGEFGGEILDITAATGFITSGKNVVITDEDGMRILVEEAE